MTSNPDTGGADPWRDTATGLMLIGIIVMTVTGLVGITSDAEPQHLIGLGMLGLAMFCLGLMLLGWRWSRTYGPLLKKADRMFRL